MENNFACESRTSDDLYSTGEISNFSLWGLIVVSYVDFIALCPLSILYVCCRIVINKHAKRCIRCTNPTSTEMVCEHSKTKKVRFCSVIERWTVWLLVDLFCTPKVGKKKINGKLHLEVGEHHSGEVGERVLGTVLIFSCITFLFWIHIKKVIVNLFVRITSQCYHKGEFAIPAACYAVNTTSATHCKINCSIWNDNLESLSKDVGPLFCFSLWYDMMRLIRDIAVMFSSQRVTVQVILCIAKIFHRKKLCFIICIGINILMFLFSIIGPIVSWRLADPSEKNQCLETWLEQLSLTLVAIFSFILPTLLLMATNDSRNNGNEISRPDRAHNSEARSDPEESTEGPRDEESNPLLAGRRTLPQYQSVPT